MKYACRHSYTSPPPPHFCTEVRWFLWFWMGSLLRSQGTSWSPSNLSHWNDQALREQYQAVQCDTRLAWIHSGWTQFVSQPVWCFLSDYSSISKQTTISFSPSHITAFETRWGHWIFSNWPNPSSRTMALWSTQPLREMSITNLPGG
jgi:hypothetical protein